MQKVLNIKKNITGHDEQWSVLKNLQLNKTEFKKIFKECNKLKIEFLCTAFDEEMA